MNGNVHFYKGRALDERREHILRQMLEMSGARQLFLNVARLATDDFVHLRRSIELYRHHEISGEVSKANYVKGVVFSILRKPENYILQASK